MKKEIEKILEEFLRKHYLLELTSCVNIPYEQEATSQILTLLESVVPEEKCNDNFKLFGRIFEFNRGFNAAIAEIKRRFNEKKV
jgi:hypothetical protein